MSYQPQSPLHSLRQFFLSQSVLSRLILVNFAVFILVNLINLILFLFEAGPHNGQVSSLTYWLSVPSDPLKLLMRPWSLFTYMFLQVSFWHIFFNMWILYFGGRIFMEFLDNNQLLSVYIFGGLAGAFFFILSFNLFPVFNTAREGALALGASASVLAVLTAVATYQPHYTVNLVFLGRVRLLYIALFFVILDLLSIDKGNPGGHLAHLGGAFWGWFFSSQLHRGRNWAVNFMALDLSGLKKVFSVKKKSHFTNVHVNHKPLTDEEYNARKVNQQEQLDAILDKISRSGYDSLSKEEKELLFNASKRKK